MIVVVGDDGVPSSTVVVVVGSCWRDVRMGDGICAAGSGTSSSSSSSQLNSSSVVLESVPNSEIQNSVNGVRVHTCTGDERLAFLLIATDLLDAEEIS